MTQLIYDYIENIERRSIKRIIHIEDQIEPSPTNPDETKALYSLYDVEFEDGTRQKFVNSVTQTANIILPGNEQLIMDLFPDYWKETHPPREEPQKEDAKKEI